MTAGIPFGVNALIRISTLGLNALFAIQFCALSSLMISYGFRFLFVSFFGFAIVFP